MKKMLFIFFVLFTQIKLFALPTIYISSDKKWVNTQSHSFYINFSENIKTIIKDDIVIENGSILNIEPQNKTKYKVSFKAIQEGDVLFYIPKNKITSENGEMFEGSNEYKVMFDKTSPSIVIEGPSSEYKSTINVNIYASEGVTGLLPKSFYVENALIEKISRVSNSKFSVSLLPTKNVALITLKVLENKCIDNAGNKNYASKPYKVYYDSEKPSVEIKTNENITSSIPIIFDINFSEDIRDFTSNSIKIENGSLSDLIKITESSYRAKVTPKISDKKVSFFVKRNSCHDMVGNGNIEGNISVYFSNTVPFPKITSSVGETTNLTDIPISIDFGAKVAGLNKASISIENGNISNPITTKNSQVFSLFVNPISEGAVHIGVKEKAAKSLSGIDSIKSNDFIVNYDSTKPSVVISSKENNSTEKKIFTLDITFSEGVANFEIGDIVEAPREGGSVNFSNFTKLDSSHYKVDAIVKENGKLKFFIPEGRVQDFSGNSNTLSLKYEITSFSPINFSGTVYSDKKNMVPTGKGISVSLFVDDGRKFTVKTDENGTYSFSSVSFLPGRKAVVWIDGNSQKRGVSVYKGPSRDINKLDIYNNALAISVPDGRYNIDSKEVSSLLKNLNNKEVSRIAKGGSGGGIFMSPDTKMIIERNTLYTSIGDFNKGKESNVSLDVDGAIVIQGGGKLYISGDIESEVSGDIRNGYGNIIRNIGSIITKDDNSHVIMGFSGANKIQRIFGDNNFNYLEFNPEDNGHILCFEKNKIIEMEYLYLGREKGKQYKIRTCDSNGSILEDNSISKISPTKESVVWNANYRDVNNISGRPIITENSTDSGNSIGWNGGILFGVLWYDSNNNGVKDPGENPVVGKRIFVHTDVNILEKFDYKDPISFSTLSNKDGRFTMQLSTGEYFLSSEILDNYIFGKYGQGVKISVKKSKNNRIDIPYQNCPKGIIEVNTDKDTIIGDGKISFREAVICAKSGDKIEFDESLDNKIIDISEYNALRWSTIEIKEKNISINTNKELNITLKGSFDGSGVGAPSKSLRAFEITDSNLKIKSVRIKGGRSSTVSSMLVSGNSKLDFEDVYIEEAVSRYSPGVRLQGGSSLTMKGGGFVNYFGRGSAFQVTSSGDILLDNVLFWNNNMSRGNGWSPAFDFLGSGNLKVKNSTFYKNYAPHVTRTRNGSTFYYGGSADPATKVAQIENCTFYGNLLKDSASRYATMVIEPKKAMNINISHTTFTGNQGGIFISEKGKGIVSINQSIIFGNNGNIEGKKENFRIEKSIIGSEFIDKNTSKPIKKPSFEKFGIYGSDSIYTLPLSMKSSAIDIGGELSLSPVASLYDQRGANRKLGPSIDLGSIEYTGNTAIKDMHTLNSSPLGFGGIFKVKVDFYTAVDVNYSQGLPVALLEIGKTIRKAKLDTSRGPIISSKSLLFTYEIDAGLYDVDGIKLIKNGLLLEGGSIIGAGGYGDVNLSFPEKTFSMVTVDTSPPSIKFERDIKKEAALSSIVQISIDDSSPDEKSYKYAFVSGADADCSTINSVDYVNGFDNRPFSIESEDYNGKYICATAKDIEGNIGYAKSANPLNIDLTPPKVMGAVLSPFRSSNDIIKFKIKFSEKVYDFAKDDIRVYNGEIKSFHKDKNSSYIVGIAPTQDGITYLEIKTRSVFDSGGLQNDSFTTYAISDRTPPKPMFPHETIYTTDEFILVKIFFGETVFRFEEDDITIKGKGQLVGLNNRNNYFFEAKLKLNEGVTTVSIDSNVTYDIAGLGNIPSSELKIIRDTTRPVPEIYSEYNETRISDIVVDILFDENVTNLNKDSISVTNGYVSSINLVSSTDIKTKFRAHISPIKQGYVTIKINENSVLDRAKNMNIVSKALGILYDSMGPVPILKSKDFYMESPFLVNLDFQEEVYDFQENDIIVENGSLVPGSLKKGIDAGSYFFLVGAKDEANISIRLKNECATDSMGNKSSKSNVLNIAYDTTSPSVELISKGGEVVPKIFSVYAKFSEPKLGFSEEDIVVHNGVVRGGSLYKKDKEYIFEIISDKSGDVNVTIPAHAFTDRAGNNNSSESVLSVFFDGERPGTKLSSLFKETNSTEIPIGISFSKEVTGLDRNDFYVENGEIKEFSLSGTKKEYQAMLIPAQEGAVVVYIKDKATKDIFGNYSIASNHLKIVYDTTPPSHVLKIDSRFSITNKLVVPIDIIFNEKVHSLKKEDILLKNATILKIEKGNNRRTFRALIKPLSNGKVSLAIKSSSVKDLAGNYGFPSSSPIQFSFDGERPKPAIYSNISSPTNLSQIQILVDFGKKIKNMSLNKIKVNHALKSQLVDLGDGKYSFFVRPIDDIDDISIYVKESSVVDYAGNYNYKSNIFYIHYDAIPPVPTIFFPTVSSGMTNKKNILVFFDFNEEVQEFNISKIRVGNNAELRNFKDKGNGRFEAELVFGHEGEFEISIPEKSAFDSSLNANLKSRIVSIIYDTTIPTPIIESDLRDFTNKKKIPICVDIMDKNITNFKIDDMAVLNGSIEFSSLEVNGSKHCVNILPKKDGMIRIWIPKGIYTNNSGTKNAESNTIAIEYDSTPPKVLSLGLLQGRQTTNISPTEVEIVFSERIIDFKRSSIEVENGKIIKISRKDDYSYIMTILPDSGGEIAVRLGKSKVHDLAGVENTEEYNYNFFYVDAFIAMKTNIVASEDIGNIVIPIEMSGFFRKPIAIKYKLVGITAKYRNDFNWEEGEIIFDTASHDAQIENINVSIFDDHVMEGNESFSVVIWPSDKNTLVRYDQNTTNVIIVDNDTAGITVSSVTGDTTESGGSATFTVKLNTKPTADVTVAISSSDTTEGTVAPGSLTFTPANWNSVQTVKVTGVDDLIVDGSVAYTVNLEAAKSSDSNYNGVDASDISLKNTDNDTAGITVSSVTGDTTESGGSATFTVKLNTKPTADVTVAISSSDTTEGTVAPGSLTFTPANWNSVQTVKVTGVDDLIVDGSVAYTVNLEAAKSSDSNYNGVDASDISLKNTDNDTAGITVSSVTGDTTESGGSATFTVKLNTKPTADVTVAISSSDTTEGTVAPGSLTFTPANWNSVQTVKVTGVDDLIVDGSVAYTVNLEAAKSSDSNYNGVDASDISLKNTDNDTAGITVSSVTGDTTESGGSATFTVKLNTKPTADVTVAISSSDTTEGTVAPGSLTFTPANWNSVQTVKVTGVDDLIVDGSVAYTVNLEAAKSSDSNYNGVDASDISLKNTDNDTAGITVSSVTGDTTESGGSATFTVKLNTKPTADVTVAISSSDTTEGTVAPGSLTFTPANWNSVQTVKVTGVDDLIVDGSVAYTVNLEAAKSSDSNYNGVDASDISLKNTDNDTAGITVSSVTGDTTESGGSATFTVKLNTKPTADVTVAISSSDTTEGTVAPGSLTFTPANWNSVQTVKVTGVDDLIVDGSVAYTVNLEAAKSSDSNYNGVDASDISLKNTDNDTAGITVSSVTGDTTESGGSATFTVKLNTKPTADVTVAISSSDTTEGTVAPGSLTFTPANWNSVQTVKVTGVDDLIVDGSVAYTVNLEAAKSSDSNYNGVDASDISLKNTDNDTAGITVSSVTGDTTESGGSATFTVKLNTKPTADVTVAISSSDTTEGTVAPGSLTFTPANWNSVQTVKVTGVDDLIVDGSVAYTVNLEAAKSSDSNYNGVDASDISLKNTDNDTAGITVSSVTGDTTESGGSATFTVKLNTKPTADVTVAISSSDTTEGTVAPGSLTFTPANWNSVQTVKVTGVDDLIVDGSVAYTVNLEAAKSSDSNYNGVDASDISLKNTDNDTAGITVSSVTGDTTESGGSATFTVKLNTKPTADVTVAISSSDTTEGTVAPGSLTFTPANWNSVQTVKVTGVDDLIVDGSVAYTVNLEAAKSSDSNYNGVDASDISLKNTDNDTAGITVSSVTGDTTESGGSATFTVKLNTKPTADVTVAISSSDTTEGTVAPGSLTFTPANWNSVQTVKVTGVDDLIVDGSVAYTVNLEAAKSSDSNYNGVDASDISLKNTDNDTAGITVSSVTGDTTESGGSATFTVKLNTKPTADVTVAISSSDTTEGTVAPGSLTFTPANWNSVQTVKVTGVDDLIVDGSVAYTVNLEAAKSSDSNYNGVDASDISLKNTDNDTAGITVSSVTGDTTESGGSATFTVKLNTKPTADVTVAISSSDTTEGTVAPGSLTFTPANWNSVQTVKVTGVDDLIVDGSVAYTVNLEAAKSSDSNYNGVDASDISLKNTDNDTAGITVSSVTGDTTESGGSATFTVKLNTKPTADVTVAISSSDTTEGTVAPGSLTFTPANWNSVQTVKVTGVDDLIVDGSVAYTVNLEAAKSSDSNYNGVDASDISLKNTDNDTAGITFEGINSFGMESTEKIQLDINITTPSLEDITVRYIIFGTANEDDYHIEGNGTIIIPAGSTKGMILINIINDKIVEDNETIILELVEPKGAILGENTVYTYTIINDDTVRGWYTISIDQYSGDNTVVSNDFPTQIRASEEFISEINIEEEFVSISILKEDVAPKDINDSNYGLCSRITYEAYLNIYRKGEIRTGYIKKGDCLDKSDKDATIGESFMFPSGSSARVRKVYDNEAEIFGEGNMVIVDDIILNENEIKLGDL